VKPGLFWAVDIFKHALYRLAAGLLDGAEGFFLKRADAGPDVRGDRVD
jgi:hypothetical protein